MSVSSSMRNVYRRPAQQYWLQNRQPKKPPGVHDATGGLIAGTGAIAGEADSGADPVYRAPLFASVVRRISRRQVALEAWWPVRQPIVFHDAAGALTGPGADLDGTANRTHLHPTTGVLVGPGADLDGTATHTTPGGSHPSSGVLTGPGAVLAGTATHKTLHATSGALQGPGATLAGTATHKTHHATSGALAGSGAVLVGTAAHFTLHATTSVLTGPGAVLAGVALRLDPGAVPGPGKALPSDRLINGSATPSDRAASAATSDRGLGSAGLSER